MTDRFQLSHAFLKSTNWSAADRLPLAGDASNRRYERLVMPETGETAILMDAPPDRGEDVEPFVNIARYLCGAGLSAPEILFEDRQNGFLVIEDFGDAVFARVVKARPNMERQLYTAATDVLLNLHQSPPPSVAAYTPGVMTKLAELAYEKYAAGLGYVAPQPRQAEFGDAMRACLTAAAATPPVLIQRDFHSENLIWLPDRPAPKNVGLLDFQDAMLGHPAYDLVSLLQDARRDVAPEIEAEMTDYFVARSGADAKPFLRDYAIVGAQRALRILGVFARLATDYGKPHYVRLIPRVWNHLEANLQHPALAEIAKCVRADLPLPTDANLKSLEDGCQTVK